MHYIKRKLLDQEIQNNPSDDYHDSRGEGEAEDK